MRRGDSVRICHDRQRDRRGGYAREYARVHHVYPFETGRAAGDIRLKAPRSRSHGQTATRIVSLALLADLQQGLQGKCSQSFLMLRQFRYYASDYFSAGTIVIAFYYEFALRAVFRRPQFQRDVRRNIGMQISLDQEKPVEKSVCRKTK